MELSCVICNSELFPCKESIESIAENQVACCTLCGQVFHQVCLLALSKNKDGKCPKCKKSILEANVAGLHFNVNPVQATDEDFYDMDPVEEMPPSLENKMDKRLTDSVVDFVTACEELSAVSIHQDYANAWWRKFKEERDGCREEYNYRLKSECKRICALADLIMEQEKYLSRKLEDLKKETSNKVEKKSSKRLQEERKFDQLMVKEFTCVICKKGIDLSLSDDPRREHGDINRYLKCFTTCGHVFHRQCHPDSRKCPECQQAISAKVKLQFAKVSSKDLDVYREIYCQHLHLEPALYARAVPQAFSGKVARIKKIVTDFRFFAQKIGFKDDYSDSEDDLYPSSFEDESDFEDRWAANEEAKAAAKVADKELRLEVGNKLRLGFKNLKTVNFCAREQAHQLEKEIEEMERKVKAPAGGETSAAGPSSSTSGTSSDDKNSCNNKNKKRKAPEAEKKAGKAKTKRTRK